MSRMDKVEYNSLKGEIWNIKKAESLKTDEFLFLLFLIKYLFIWLL